MLDALLTTASDLAIGLILAIVIFSICALMVRSLRGLERREDARREEFTPAGSDDQRRAMRYQGVSPELLGKERVGFYAASTREARRG